MRNSKIFLLICCVILGSGLLRAIVMGGALEDKLKHCETTTKVETITTPDHDTWYSVGDTIYGAEWRHLTSDEDSMAVVHIWQNGRLNTWIGKPCNCY